MVRFVMKRKKNMSINKCSSRFSSGLGVAIGKKKKKLEKLLPHHISVMGELAITDRIPISCYDGFIRL
jgi:hypothetical protein